MQKVFRTVPIYFWFFTIWSASKLFQYILNQGKTIWEIIWERAIAYFDNDEYKLFVNGFMVFPSIAFVLVLSIFTYFDFSLKPSFIRKYKVNPQTNEPPDFKTFMKSIFLTSIFGFLLKPTLIAIYYGLKWRGMPSLYPLPNIFTVILTCFISDHVLDIGSYTTHRILHHRFLYKHIHKMHHEYKSTIAVTAVYVHPIEHMFSNLFPQALLLIIMRSHIATSWIHLTSYMISSAIYHSGYHLPFLNSPEFHDFHHVKFDYNYSNLGLIDWIFGTDKTYRNSVYEKRDKLLLSLKSAHELYPAEKNEMNVKIQ